MNYVTEPEENSPFPFPYFDELDCRNLFTDRFNQFRLQIMWTTLLVKVSQVVFLVCTIICSE